MNVLDINDQYNTLDQGHIDPNGGSNIRNWMRSPNISFDELSFTEAELEAKVRRVHKMV